MSHVTEQTIPAPAATHDRGREGPGRAAAGRRAPGLERLEDRTVPSSFTAASVSDLIAAIHAANAAGGPNTINLVAGTTFNLTAVDNTTDDATGLPVIAATDNLSIVGNGDVIQRSTATGTPAFRLFDVASGASLALANLTLQGGSALQYQKEGQGGAIYSQGSLNLNGVTVQSNIAQGGNYSGGGGIFSSGLLTVNASTIQNNQALGLDGSSPGENGRATAGGGILVWAGTASLTNVTVQNNTAQGGRGGPPGKSFFGGPHVRGGNGGNAAAGGMLVLNGATVSLHNCIVTQNSAVAGKGVAGGTDGLGEGGGLWIDSLASVCLDTLTVAKVSNNKASTSSNNIYGSYTICP
jgi:hypothetical protein